MGLPVYVFLSLCNATHTVHRYGTRNDGVVETRPLGREIVVCPEIYIDSFEVDLIDAMKPAFNTLWNAVGHLECERYSDIELWKASDPYNMNWRSY
jgi:hypothetical protein